MRIRALLPAIAPAFLVVAWTSLAAQARETGPRQAELRQLFTRYTLVEVGEKSLPALIEREWRCRKNVTAAVLLLRGDGRWLLETQTRKVCGDRTEVDRDRDDGIYRTEGARMRFFDGEGRQKTDGGWSIGTDIDLENLKAGSIGNDGVLTVQLADGHTRLVFRRQVLRVTPPASHRPQHHPGAAAIKVAIS
jgi:hypothetical protein